MSDAAFEQVLSQLEPELAEIMRRGRRVAVERVRARQAYEEVRPEWCICADEYWMRGLDDPQCRHDEMEDLHNPPVEQDFTDPEYVLGAVMAQVEELEPEAAKRVLQQALRNFD